MMENSAHNLDDDVVIRIPTPGPGPTPGGGLVGGPEPEHPGFAESSPSAARNGNIKAMNDNIELPHEHSSCSWILWLLLCRLSWNALRLPAAGQPSRRRQARACVDAVRLVLRPLR
jgi:hypothetical protein